MNNQQRNQRKISLLDSIIDLLCTHDGVHLWQIVNRHGRASNVASALTAPDLSKKSSLRIVLLVPGAQSLSELIGSWI